MPNYHLDAADMLNEALTGQEDSEFNAAANLIADLLKKRDEEVQTLCKELERGAILYPIGWTLVPVEPSEAHLASMAMRNRHDYGLKVAEVQANMRSGMKQLYEEAIGKGFFVIERPSTWPTAKATPAPAAALSATSGGDATLKAVDSILAWWGEDAFITQSDQELAVKELRQLRADLARPTPLVGSRDPEWVPVAEWPAKHFEDVEILYVLHKGWAGCTAYWDDLNKVWRRTAGGNPIAKPVCYVAPIPRLPALPAFPQS